MLATQGYSHSVLAHHFPQGARNPYLIPSLSMGIGMGASMYVSALLSDPHVALCGKLMFSQLEPPTSVDPADPKKTINFRSLPPEEAKKELAQRRSRLFEIRLR